jgi:hypothetical protein
LTTTIGLRYDYFAYNRRPHWSPRFSFSYQFTSSTSLNGAFGVYYQDLPLSLMAVSKNYRDLRDPKAHHYILGTSHLLAEDTRLTVEGYYKSYENLPLDMYQPQFSVIDWVVDYDSYSVLRNLTDAGEALSYGIETTLQKKLVRGLYGLVSGSYSRSRYKDLLGTWRNRLYDNRVLFSVEAGYKPNNRWEYSLRWVFAGGNPYTPLNLEASQFYNRTVLDSTRVNQERRPDYHSLNLRLDHHTYWKSASLVWYVSIWNVYNRKNVAFYYWDKSDRSEGVAHQWGILPIVGFELEF